MIGIVDYGLGNVQAFINIYRKLGVDAAPVRTEAELCQAKSLILPGVGAFDWVMGRITQSGMLDGLNHQVLEKKVPVLGVCVGMQIMADGSDEGKDAGLGWIPGHVRRFDDAHFNQRTHLPHMGWNDITPQGNDPLFEGQIDPQFYFLHSYYFDAANTAASIATAYYGIEFTCAVRRDNIWATQFHPEKSHSWGVSLLRRFSELS